MCAFSDKDNECGTSFPICATPTPNPILDKLRANKLTSFDTLHLSVVYWNSILQILRSPHDEFKCTMQQSIQIYDNIVFNIVYNSLSCVLFAINKETSAIDNMVNKNSNNLINDSLVMPTNGDINQEEWKIGWLQNGDFDCDNNILFRKEQSPDTNNTDAVAVNGHDNALNDDAFSDYQLNGLLKSGHSGVLHINYDMDFHTVIKSNSSDEDEDQVNEIHLTNGHAVDLSENDNHTNAPSDEQWGGMKPGFVETDSEKSLIYSVKNAKINGLCDSLNAKNGLLNENGAVGVVCSSRDENETHPYSFFNGVQKINKFISTNVISILVAAANASIGHSHSDINSDADDDDDAAAIRLPQLFTADQLMLVHTPSHKKLLMQLFEITLGVMMCNAKAENSGKFFFSFFALFSHFLIVGNLLLFLFSLALAHFLIS